VTGRVVWLSVDANTRTTFVTSFIANQYRGDLQQIFGYGYHGFTYPVPASLKDGQTRYMFAYYAGTSLLVNGTYGIWPMNCPAGSTGYQPYYADSLTSVNTTNWNQNGTVSTSSAGFTSAGAGSLISKVAAPQNTFYQVKMTLKLTASGGFIWRSCVARPTPRRTEPRRALTTRCNWRSPPFRAGPVPERYKCIRWTATELRFSRPLPFLVMMA